LLEKIVKIITEKFIEKPPYRLEISPFLSDLLTTSNLRTLDLALIKRDIHSWTLKSRIFNTVTVRSSVIATQISTFLEGFSPLHQNNKYFFSLLMTFVASGNVAA
jgi:hypothetical protein